MENYPTEHAGKVFLVFSKSTTWLSRAIRWFTNSRTSHVMIEYYSDLWGGWWIAEASATGVRKVPAYKSLNGVVATFQCNFDVKKPLSEISQYFGNRYDFLGLLLFGWVIIVWKIFKKKIHKPCTNSKSQFCSELVARFLKAAKFAQTDTWDPEMISPEAILEYCETHPPIFTHNLTEYANLKAKLN